MHYYFILESATSAILYIHEDPYLISALNAGVLDCQIKIGDRDFYEKVISEPSVKQSKIQIHVETFDLDLHPDTQRKKTLIEMRAPAFQLLIQNLHLAKAKNTLGFFDNTSQVISKALSDPSRIQEYATVMKISEEFAASELSMLADSLNIDNFRIFTISMFLQKKINACETVDEVTALLKPIRRAFWAPGIPNV